MYFRCQHKYLLKVFFSYNAALFIHYPWPSIHSKLTYALRGWLSGDTIAFPFSPPPPCLCLSFSLWLRLKMHFWHFFFQVCIYIKVVWCRVLYTFLIKTGILNIPAVQILWLASNHACNVPLILQDKQSIVSHFAMRLFTNSQVCLWILTWYACLSWPYKKKKKPPKAISCIYLFNLVSVFDI